MTLNGSHPRPPLETRAGSPKPARRQRGSISTLVEYIQVFVHWRAMCHHAGTEEPSVQREAGHSGGARPLAHPQNLITLDQRSALAAPCQTLKTGPNSMAPPCAPLVMSVRKVPLRIGFGPVGVVN
jgi:hypothetical protein